MDQDQKGRGPSADDDLDDAIGAADDTGMVAQQQEINAEEAMVPEYDDEEPEGGRN